MFFIKAKNQTRNKNYVITNTMTKDIGSSVSFRLRQKDIIRTQWILHSSPIVDKVLVQLNTRLSQECVIIALGITAFF